MLALFLKAKQFLFHKDPNTHEHYCYVCNGPFDCHSPAKPCPIEDSGMCLKHFLEWEGKRKVYLH